VKTDINLIKKQRDNVTPNSCSALCFLDIFVFVFLQPVMASLMLPTDKHVLRAITYEHNRFSARRIAKNAHLEFVILHAMSLIV